MSAKIDFIPRIGQGPDGKRREYAQAWFSPVDEHDKVMINFLNTLPEAEIDVLLAQVSPIFCAQPYFRYATDDKAFSSNEELAKIAELVYTKPAEERAEFARDVASLIPPGFAGSNRLGLTEELWKISDKKMRAEFVEQARAMMEICLLGIKTNRGIDANTWATPLFTFFEYFKKYDEKEVYAFSKKAKACLEVAHREQAALLSTLKVSAQVVRNREKQAKPEVVDNEAKEASEATLAKQVLSLCHAKTEDHDRALISKALHSRPAAEREQFITDARSLFPKGLYGCNQSAIVETLAQTPDAKACSALAAQAHVVMEALFLDLDPENPPHFWEGLFSRFYACSDEQREKIAAEAKASLDKVKVVQTEIRAVFKNEGTFMLATVLLGKQLPGYDRHKAMQSSGDAPPKEGSGPGRPGAKT